MKYYKTLGGVLSAAFEERGYKNDKGGLIKATEKPMTEREYVDFKTKEMKKKIKRMRTLTPKPKELK